MLAPQNVSLAAMVDPPLSGCEQSTLVSTTTTTVSTGTTNLPPPKSPVSSDSSVPRSIAIPPVISEQEAVKRTAEARTAFLASLQSVGSTADAGLQGRATDINSNSAAIAKQEQQLKDSTAALAKETAKYQKLTDETRTKLKEIGDVQNFAEVIEREMMVLEETLRIIENGEEGDGEADPQEGKAVQKKKKWWF